MLSKSSENTSKDIGRLLTFAMASVFVPPLKAKMLANNKAGKGIGPVINGVVGNEVVTGEQSTMVIYGDNLHLVVALRFENEDINSAFIEKSSNHLVARISCPSDVKSESVKFRLVAPEIGFDGTDCKAFIRVSKPHAVVAYGDEKFMIEDAPRRPPSDSYSYYGYTSSLDDTTDGRLPGIGAELI